MVRSASMDQSSKVRAVVRLQYGCTERSDWYLAGSTEAMEAMEALMRKQTDVCTLGWETWCEAVPPSGLEMASNGSNVPLC